MNGPNTNWGHPVAYHPMLAHFFGSVNAAIFFGQLRYWSARTENPLGVYKAAEEWTEETGLSYREQVTARRILSDRGFVAETNKRLEHRIYFLIDWDAFNRDFEAWPGGVSRTTKTHLGKDGKRSSPNDENAVGEATNQRSSISTETTAETTAENIPAAPSEPLAAVEDAAIKNEKPAKPAKAEKPPKVEKTDAEKAKDEKLAAQQEVCRKTWAAYCEAYAARYRGVEPARNPTTNSQVINLVKRIGKDAPDVARFYVTSVNEAFVVGKSHDLGLLVSGYQGYRTQWITGQTMTTTRAKQIDQSQANFSAVDEAMAIRRAKQQGAQNAR